MEELRATESEIRQRIGTYPEGQFVLEMHGAVGGVIYSQRIEDSGALHNTTFREVAALHNPDGRIVQALAVNVLPSLQQHGLGDQLLEFLLRISTVQPGIDLAVGVTLCKHYALHAHMPMAEYICLRNRHGQIVDPILNFHASHGAEIRGVVEGYRPGDVQNQGKGVLVEYDLIGRLAERQSKQERNPAINVRAAIEEAVLGVMGERAAGFSTSVPLWELGFDSLRLLELRLLLSQQLGLDIEPTFFFRYNTVESITGFFELGGESGPAVSNSGQPKLDEPVAIIGMACRFPGGVTSPEEFWDLLVNGVDAISQAPADRCGLMPCDSGQPQLGGFLDGVGDFDAAFFRIAPIEAAAMDPQQRLLLETHWEALERAGINPETLKSSCTGIYAGLFGDDYKLLQSRQPTRSEYFGTGTSNAVAAGRIAYFLGTEGPALCVDTACSSSLVAVHLACQSLQRGEINLGLASGVNLLLANELSAAFSQSNMLASDGRCKTFDAAADGYVRSEGCGVLVLKRLRDALDSGDPILAVIRGTFINQDGASNGLTAPNGLAQEAMIRGALLNANLQARDISYVEAHGTGTALGDPIEIGALDAVYGAGRSADDPLVTGSVKTNIGHTEAAAGIAGLMKVVLALQSGCIPPHLHFKQINPLLAKANILIPTEARQWHSSGTQKRRAAVSSFGFSGTNAHALLEEAPLPPKVAFLFTGQGSQYLNMGRELYETEPLFRERIDQCDRVLKDCLGRSLVELLYPAAPPTHRDLMESHPCGQAANFAVECALADLWRSWGVQPDVVLGHSLGDFAAAYTAGSLSLDEGLRLVVERGRLMEAAIGSMVSVRASEAEVSPYLVGQPDVVIGVINGPQSVVISGAHEGVARVAAELQAAGYETRKLDIPVAAHSPMLDPVLDAFEAAVKSVELKAPRCAVVSSMTGQLVSGELADPAYWRRHLRDTVHFADGVQTLDQQGCNVFVEIGPQATLLNVAAGISGPRERESIASLSESDPARDPMLAGLERMAAMGLRVHRLATPSRRLFTLSAKNEQALLDLAKRHSDLLGAHPESDLASVCCTANTGRAHFEYRLAFPAASAAELRTKLDVYSQAGAPRQGQPKVAFLFTGQGSQYLNMGRELYETEPLFRERIDQCDRVLKDCLGRSLVELLYPAAPPTHRDLMESHPCGQAANFAVECALADLWRSWGVQPDVVLGHSLGDFAAAYTAGSLSLEEGLRLVVERGRLMEAAIGSMVSVRASEAEVSPYLVGQPDVVIGVINGPQSVVISGAHKGVARVAAELQAAGYETRKLDIPVAAHSPMLDPVLDAFEAAVKSVELKAPRCAVVSSMTGQLVSGELADPAYWRRHLRDTVHFADGVRTLLDRGCTSFLEIGPASTLLGMAELMVPAELPLLPSLREGLGDWQQMLTCLSELYVQGGAIDWANFHRYDRRREALLPTYPFQRRRYWFESSEHPHKDASQAAENAGTLFYDVGWERQNRPPVRWKVGSPGRWLILTDRSGVGSALTARLRTLGETVVEASSADGWPAAEALLKATGEDLPLQGIVHLWAVDHAAPESDSLSSAGLMAIQECNLSAALRIVQNLAGSGGATARLWVATQGAQAVNATDAVAVSQTPIWGLGRVIALEHDELWGGLVDLDPLAEPAAQGQALLSELLRQRSDDEIEIAYRKGTRFVARLKRASLRSASTSSITISDRAAYLITGGLGGLGLAAAEWLAEQGAGKIVLTGRRGASSDGQRAAIERLINRGVKVEVEPVDVTDEAGMQGLFERIAAGEMPLKGVLHTAGAFDVGLLLKQDPDQFASVLAAKVAGGWLLHELTRELPLDFLVYYSSIASILGTPGVGMYAAANAFLDGLASHRRQSGLPGLSVNWGIWSDAGMAKRPGLQFTGVRPMAAEMGIQALTQLVLRTPAEVSRVGVVVIDWSSYPGGGRERPFLANFVARTPPRIKITDKGTLARELAPLSGSHKLEHLRDHLQEITGRLLGLSDLPERTTGFTELGMDSLISIKLVRHMEFVLDRKFPATIVFEHPSIDALAQYIDAGSMREAETEAWKKSAETGSSPIAVIGMACRFPGADTPEDFWQLLRNGADMVREVPGSRWNVDDYYDPQRPAPGKMYAREGGFVEGVENFDPLFFGIAPREAAGMDPQHWLLLETGWEALEHAGLAQSSLVDSATGVFIGIGLANYGSFGDGQELNGLDTHAITSGGHSVAAGRIAYALGLQGPTMAVDTACSSSLVALHLACQSLRAGECNLALSGGVNLILSPAMHVALSQMQVLSPDGRCKTFDAAADGFGRGEGAGMVVLKRLSDAEADGDNILAVIKGSAINHDGPSSGLTVPNKRAQEKMLRQALANAGITPDQIAYIETHGTGTPLGDPIEIRALSAVFGKERRHPLYVGTVKSNIGHLEAAAGIAGFIKTVLSFLHREIPPQLHFRNPNPYIEWDECLIEVPTTGRPWPSLDETHPGACGISSFGLSGTNAHVVVAAADRQVAPVACGIERPMHVLTLSAKTDAALKDLVGRYLKHLETHPEIDLADLCYTAATGRNYFTQRLAIAAADCSTLQAKLSAVFTSEPIALPARKAPRIAFLFTGQGSQYRGMGAELYRTQPVFRAAVDRCDDILQPHFSQSIAKVLFEENEDARIHETAYTQPALFVLEYALATLWQSWGVRPEILIGHSVGEFVAACVAGVFSLEDGLKLIAARGRLMNALPAGGEMISLQCPEERVQREIASGVDAEVSIAAVNGPENTVISGRREAVARMAEQLAAEGIQHRKLTASHAFHSSLMQPMLAEFTEVAKTVAYHSPRIPIVSNVTGKVAGEEMAGWQYWVRHITEPVRFADGIAATHEQGIDTFIEIGPKPVLLGMARQCLGSSAADFLPSLREGQSDWRHMLESLGTLYVRGIAVNWAGFDEGYVRRKIALPTYPFQRQLYWRQKQKLLPSSALRPFVGRMTRLPLHDETVFETDFSTDAITFLADHRVHGTVVSPGALQLAMVLNAGEIMLGGQPALLLKDVILPQPLIVPEQHGRTVQTVFEPVPKNGQGAVYGFKVVSFDLQDETPKAATHATGSVGTSPGAQLEQVDLAELLERCSEAQEVGAFYESAEAAHVSLGEAFQWLTGLWHSQSANRREVLAKMAVPASLVPIQGHRLHPGLLDACFQAAVSAEDAPAGAAMVPFAIEQLQLNQAVHSDGWWCHACQIGPRRWNIKLLSKDGLVLASLKGFEMRAAWPDAVHGKGESWRDWLYQVSWETRVAFGHPPSYFAEPSAVAHALQPSVALLAIEDASEPRQNLMRALHQLSGSYVAAAFAKVGFTFQPGMSWRTTQIARQIGVIPSYHRLLERLLGILVEDGVLRRDGEVWHAVKAPAEQDPSRQLAATVKRHGATPELALLAGCGERLSEVLRGVQDPLDLIFPGGDTSTANELNDQSQALNGLVNKVVKLAAAQLPSKRGLRILEIGAGTGGTTAGLLPLLPAEQTEYAFTDIGLSFLSKAQARFSNYGFVRYRLLDIQQPPAAQGVDQQWADLVIAANVLHATSDLTQTLANVRQLLQPGGQVVLLEVTQRSRWMDLSFGLTDGWWRFADHRQDYPLLSAQEWKETLLANGFGNVEAMEVGGQAVIIARADEIVAASTEGTWLIFDERPDSQGPGEVLARELRRRGKRPTFVYPGDRYERTENGHFTVRSREFEDYRQVLADASNIRGIVHLWSLNTASCPMAEATRLSCGSVLLLAQALQEARIQPEGFWIVTQDAQSVIAGDRVGGVAQSAVWGLGRVIAAEHPELKCVRIDLGAGDSVEDHAVQIYAEIVNAAQDTKREDQIAYRDGSRYVARLTRLKPEMDQTLVCQAEATYLIAGGLGGLGLKTAASLASLGAKHLLLIGRNAPSHEAQAQLALLANQGVSVSVAQADIGDAEALRLAIGSIDPAHPLRGVIHSAGVLDDGALPHQNWERFEKVFRSKVQGSWNLHELTKDLPLDFFVLYSGAAGLLGNRGQANHAAAAVFLDSLAHFRRAQGLPGLAIDWGAWSEIGSAAHLPESTQAEIAQRGIEAISPEKGISALQGLAGSLTSQAGVLRVDWTAFLRGRSYVPPYFAAFGDATAFVERQAPGMTQHRQSIRGQLEVSTPAAREKLLRAFLQQQAAQTLLLSGFIDPETGLRDLGMDSLMAIEFRRQLERQLELRLPSTIVFEHPTLDLLNQYLLKELFGESGEIGGEKVPMPEAESMNWDKLSDAELSDLLSMEIESLEV